MSISPASITVETPLEGQNGTRIAIQFFSTIRIKVAKTSAYVDWRPAPSHEGRVSSLVPMYVCKRHTCHHYFTSDKK